MVAFKQGANGRPDVTGLDQGVSWGAPGGNMFEPGSFTVAQRLTNLGYKGAVFAVIGFFAGVLGTSLSNGLLALRKMV
ncbi:hypothetical protein TSOC_009216 [Tetrabaena socialis]|uniref:Uncharacterized protein n=1 Tax=Tetrabaena socialis TaxID=47790 RepID=A0A2J7ZWH1_9CHLO|nr:hypothetical protein TSOC_009216 [Tetrabaena socialis]|eukprot:PNH04604.1 hypothetical protein TSOC_009216 [Tetrabaena socialis]